MLMFSPWHRRDLSGTSRCTFAPVMASSNSPAGKSRLRPSAFAIVCSSYMPREHATTLLAISASYTRTKMAFQRCPSKWSNLPLSSVSKQYRKRRAVGRLSATYSWKTTLLNPTIQFGALGCRILQSHLRGEHTALKRPIYLAEKAFLVAAFLRTIGRQIGRVCATAIPLQDRSTYCATAPFLPLSLPDYQRSALLPDQLVQLAANRLTQKELWSGIQTRKICGPFCSLLETPFLPARKDSTICRFERENWSQRRVRSRVHSRRDQCHKVFVSPIAASSGW